MTHILVIDDDPEFRQTISIILHRLGYTTYQAADIQQGLKIFHEQKDISIILLDLYLAEGKCTESISHFQVFDRFTQIIIMTGQSDPDSAAQTIENGAWDYLEKPITGPRLKLILQRAIAHQNEKTTQVSIKRIQREGLIGVSPSFISCLEQLSLVATNSSNVLLYGETGTGKELFARAIHNCSLRSEKPFVTLDCTSLPENLAESLLLGHTRGSFTGANTSKTGLIMQAHQGTLFLDEIGELPLNLQKSFLRILQERTVRPLGSSREENSDFRLVAATNRNLEQMVERGQFRKDLYYRLVTSQIRLPALRNRKEDIRPLMYHFMNQACEEYKLPSKKPSLEFINDLHHAQWPGNVRELMHVIFASINAAQHSLTLHSYHLPVTFRAQAVKQSVVNNQAENAESMNPTAQNWLEFKCQLPSINGNKPPTLKQVRNLMIRQVESAYLQKLINLTQGDIRDLCQLADLSRPRCYELLKKYGLKRNSAL